MEIKKSVLIITYDMVPYSSNWGSCQRMYFLAEFLQSHGYDTHVIHSKEINYGNFGVLINFHSIPTQSGLPQINTKKLNINLKDRLFSLIRGEIIYVIKKFNLISIENRIFNEAVSGMGIAGYLFSRNVKKILFDTLKDYSISDIIISGPPFSIFLLTRTIKEKFPNITIILDYRDPWNTYSRFFFPTILEKLCFSYSDKYVFFNEKMMNDTISKFKLPKVNCCFVTNGFSSEDWKTVLENNIDTYPSREKKCMVISYVGSVSFQKGGYRDFSSFFDAFEIFQNDKEVLLRFVGVNNSDAVIDLKNRFLNKIEIIPPVFYKKSLEFMLNSDILIHVHTDPKTGKSVMAGKIFDYLKSGRILFIISSQNNAYVMNFVKENHLGLTCSNQTTEILNCLEILYKNWENGSLNTLRQDNKSNSEMYSREFQNFKYLKILK